MKLLDMCLLSLVSILLINTTYGYSELLFSNANNWIPDVFSDAVSWHPGKTFHWGVASCLVGLFLCRFAKRPILMAVIVAIITVAINLYPSYTQLGSGTATKQLFSSYQTAVGFLQLLGLLPIITWVLHWLIQPDREHEVIEQD